MTVQFFKYQGTGNDFVIFDNREQDIQLSEEKIKNLCDRRFGIGADGLMLLQKSKELDFEMKYYNSDGREGTMCGNGGRCMVAFAGKLGIVSNVTKFKTIDGIHSAKLIHPAYVQLHMSDVTHVQRTGETFFLNTGSPHYVEFVENVKDYPVVDLGRKIRYSDAFKPGGTNVNFVEIASEDTIFVRTYERGVEDETLSCGTGVTASSLCAFLKKKSDRSSFVVKTLGGELKVSFRFSAHDSFSDIYLEGPANFVYEGNIQIG